VRLPAGTVSKLYLEGYLDDGYESNNGENCRALAPPIPGDPGVEEDGIGEPGDQRPGHAEGLQEGADPARCPEGGG
jgi:hypothetical protein